MHTRLFITVLAVVLAAAIIAPVAGADPVNAKNSTPIQAVCGTQTVNVVVIGNGEFTPAHVVDNNSTSVFIPTAFHTKFTFNPSDGSPPTINFDDSAKTAPISNTVTCTIPPQQLFTGPQGTAMIEGTVTGFFTPR
jgi:hypothetical protein